MKSTLGRLSGVALVLTGVLLSAPSQTAGDTEAGNLAMTIAVKNYARVDNETLEKAEGVAMQIFRKTGVETRWVDPTLTPDGKQEISADLQLVIIPSKMADRLHHFSNSAMGLAPGTGPARHLVYVFYNSVEALAERREVFRNATKAQILGSVIAHEIGHVLLNLPSHSATGIMQGDWHLEDLQDAACGRLLFTLPQAELIRADVARRVGQGKATEVAALEFMVQTIAGEDGHEQKNKR